MPTACTQFIHIHVDNTGCTHVNKLEISLGYKGMKVFEKVAYTLGDGTLFTLMAPDWVIAPLPTPFVGGVDAAGFCRRRSERAI